MSEVSDKIDSPTEKAVRHVFRWDLDKTYLRTDFESFRGLVRSALEKAEAKQAVPGAAALLRELTAVGGARVSFISGSPVQMRKVLAKKLALDGITVDDFVLKHNLRNLLRGRFRALREQVGYKLPALLEGRRGLAASVRETCFGDDAEADAFVYSLYADLVAGNVGLDVLGEVLELARVYPDDASRTLRLAGEIERSPGTPRGAVDRIFIHLDKHSPVARFDRYGRRCVPIFNYFQAALVLAEDGQLSVEAVVRVASDMIAGFGYGALALANTAEDLVRRGRLAASTVRKAAAAARATHAELAARLDEIDSTSLPVAPERPIDYVAAFKEDRPLRGRKEEKRKKNRIVDED